AVEPDNQAIALRMRDASERRGTRLPTVPSTIGLERGTNPFLRYTEPGIVKSLVQAGRLQEGAAPVEAFAALREWKNVF
ncbi:hydroxyacylglutathione hydrolase, partial [Enterococcus faecium]